MVLKEYAAIDIETKDGKTYSVDESGIIRDSLTTSSSCSSGGGIPAGSCNAGTISVSFRAPSGLAYSKLAKAKVHLYVWYGNASKTKVGVYNITSAENNYGIYTVSGSDNVGLLDDGCYSAVDTKNAQNWLFTVLSGKFEPVSVIFNQICSAYGVPHYNSSENQKIIPESGNTMLCTCVSEECSIESVKDFASYLAEYLGCFIVPAPDGRLRFCRFGDRKCSIELNETNIQRGSYQRSPYYAAPTIWKISFDSGYGSWWYRTTDIPDNAAPLSVNLTNNPFWQAQEDMIPDQYSSKLTQMIKYMWSYICDAAYADDGNPCFNPFRCTVFVQYYFRVGDMVTIVDPFTGEKFKSYVTDVTWTFRGGQQISFAGEDTRTLSVNTNRNAAKKANDYSKYLYRKSKNGSGENVNTKYALSKSGHTITLTGSDGTVYNVTDDDTIYTHPKFTEYANGLYKVTVNDEGHVTEAVGVTKDDITALGIPGEDNDTTYEIRSEFSNEKLDIIKEKSKNGVFVDRFRVTSITWYGSSELDDGCISLSGYMYASTFTGESYTPISSHQVGSKLSAKIRPVGSASVYAKTSLTAESSSADSFTLRSYILTAPAKWDSITNPTCVKIGYDTSTGTATLITDFANDILVHNVVNRDNNTVTGKRNLVEGTGNTVSGDNNLVGGSGNTVKTNDATVAGIANTVTEHGYNVAMSGYGLYCDAVQQAIFGRYNAKDPGVFDKGWNAYYGKYALIVGNGSSDTNRSNAFAVDWDGNLWCGNDTTSLNAQINSKVETAELTKYLLKTETAVSAKALSSGRLRTAFCRNSATSFSDGYVWFKIGTATLNGAYTTVCTTFVGTVGYGAHALYTCRIRNGADGNVENVYFRESGRCGTMPTGLFQIVAINGTSGTSLELWAKARSRYEGTKVLILEEYLLEGTDQDNFWSLTSKNNTGAATAPTSGDINVNSSDRSLCYSADILTETAWTAVPTTGGAATSTNTLKYKKSGNTVHITGSIRFSSVWTAPVCGTLPAGYRPATAKWFAGWSNDVHASYGIRVDMGGIITLYAPSTASNWFVPSASYNIDVSFITT